MEKLPALKAAILFALGITAGYYARISVEQSLILLICLFILAALCYKYSISKNLFTFSLTALIFCSGIFKIAIDRAENINNAAFIPPSKEGEKYELICIVSSPPLVKENKTSFEAEAVSLVTENDTISISGTIMVNIFRYFTLQKDMNAGDKLSLAGKLIIPSEGRNPGDFNYREYLALNGIHKQFIVNGFDNIRLLSGNNLPFWKQFILSIRKFAINEIDKNYSGDEAGYLKGLVAGDRSSISEETKASFLNSGVTHLLAVSGLNVAYIVLLLTFILSLLNISRKSRFLIVVIKLALYCLITGYPPSIIRASLMAVLFMAAYYLERKTNFYNITAMSALLILIFDSRQLFDAGFILSYSAVFSMVFVYERIEKITIRSKKLTLWIKDAPYKWLIYYILVLALTTAAAQIGTFPLTAYFFNSVSLVSVFTNIIIVPLSNLSLALGILEVFFAAILPLISSFIAESNNYVLKFQLLVINFFSGFEFSAIDMFTFTLPLVICSYISLYIIFNSKKNNIIKRCIASFLIILIPYMFQTKEDKFSLHILSAGTKSSVLIITSEGENILCFSGDDGFDAVSKTILPYLKKNGVSEIDLLIDCGNSTYDIEKFTSGISVYNIISNNTSYQSYASFVSSGDAVSSFKSLKLYFISNSENDNLAVVIHRPEISIVIAPLMEQKQIKYYIDSLNPQIALYKIDGKRNSFLLHEGENVIPLNRAVIYEEENNKLKQIYWQN